MDNVVVGEIEIAWNNFYAERHWECNPILQEVRMEAFSCLSSWFLHNGSSNFNIKEAAHRQRGIHTLGKDNNYGLFSAENSSLPIWPVKQTVAFWGLWTEDHMIWGGKKQRISWADWGPGTRALSLLNDRKWSFLNIWNGEQGCT